MFKKQMRMTRALPYEMSGPEVSHPTEQVEDAVPHGDQSGPAEHDGFPSVSWLGELGEDNARHTGLYEDPSHALDAHQQDGRATLGGGGPSSVPGNISQSSHSRGNQDQAVSPDGVLGLHTEEEGGGEVLHVLHTDDVVRTTLAVRLKVSWRIISN